MYIQCTIEQPAKGILPLDQGVIYLVVLSCYILILKISCTFTKLLFKIYLSFSYQQHSNDNLIQ